jgi:hypothetical protein
MIFSKGVSSISLLACSLSAGEVELIPSHTIAVLSQVERIYWAGLSPATVGSAWSALFPPPLAFMPSIAPPFSSSGAGATLFLACWGWESGLRFKSVLNVGRSRNEELTLPSPWTMFWPSMGPLSLDPSPLRGIVNCWLGV